MIESERPDGTARAEAAALRQAQALHYRFGAGARSGLPGAHRSRGGDGGLDLRGLVPLHRARDLRRLDLLASLRDPFGQWQVRESALRQSITVAVVADRSSSMGDEGKADLLADFVGALAGAAWLQGDRFAFVGAGDAIVPSRVLRPTRHRDGGLALAARLRHEPPADGDQGRALPQAARWLPRRRCLVFLTTDLHLDDATLAATLDSLAGHEVVPVLLGEPDEVVPGGSGGSDVTRLGWHALVDAESGRERGVWWRPSLVARWRQAFEARRQQRLARLARRGMRPLLLTTPFDARIVTRHFAGHAAS